MSVSEIFKSPYKRLDVFYYDFKAQYKAIAEVIESARPENVAPLLKNIVETGTHKVGKRYMRFNPAVIKHLKNLFELPA